MLKKFLLAGVQILFVGITAQPEAVFAQPGEMEIKLSDNYMWGEAFSQDRQEAINEARIDLIEKIVVMVVSDTELSVYEDEETYENIFQMRSRSISRMELRGLNYLPEQRRDVSWKVLAYISKEDFNRSIEIASRRLFSILEDALVAEKNGEQLRAAQLYFQVFAETHFFPLPLYTNENKHGSETDLRRFADRRMQQFLNEIQVKVKNVSSRSTGDNVENYITFVATHNNKPLQGVTISLDQPGYGEHQFIGGQTEVFTDLLPEDRIQQLTFRLKPMPPTGMESEMRSVASRVSPTRLLSFDVDFSPVILLDFSTTKLTSTGFRFTPTIKNLGVYDIQWNFGDGNTSQRTAPRHDFDNWEEPYTISMTVNRSDRLSIKKILNSDGSLTGILERKEAAPKDIKPVSSPRETIVAMSLLSTNEAQQIEQVMRYRNAQQLVNFLTSMQNRNLVKFGTQSDVSEGDKSIVIIINPQSRVLEAILTPTIKDVRYDVISNKKIDNIAQEYKGYGSIWVQFQ